MKKTLYLCSVCLKKIEPSKDHLFVCPGCFAMYHTGCKFGHICGRKPIGEPKDNPKAFEVQNAV